MTATLLVHFGSPANRKEVGPFINDIFAARLGFFSRPVAFLARHRALKKYDAVGFAASDEIRRFTERLGENVFVAAQYGKPPMGDALSEIEGKGIETVRILPLYPHATLEMYDEIASKISRLKKQYFRNIHIRWAGPFYDHPLFIEAWADQVKKSLGEFENRDSVHIIFSAHAMPPNRGDNSYERQVEESASLISKALGSKNSTSVAYQSAMGRSWSSPPLETELSRFVHRGISDCLVVPISFLFDNVETLFDIDRVAIPAAKRAGMRDVRRAAPPGSSETIVKMFSGLKI